MCGWFHSLKFIKGINAPMPIIDTIHLTLQYVSFQTVQWQTRRKKLDFMRHANPDRQKIHENPNLHKLVYLCQNTKRVH